MRKEPLASRLRPTNLNNYYGQQHILSPGNLLRRMIEADRVSSMILYGPPGTGKTSLASVIANTTSSRFVQINATTAGKKDMQEAVTEAKKHLDDRGVKTILFIDEIHRFNKAQQDYLLPFVENGTVILIGATTENPFFEVNKALVSRSQIFELLAVPYDQIQLALDHAMDFINRDSDYPSVSADPKALAFMAEMACRYARWPHSRPLPRRWPWGRQGLRPRRRGS